MEQGKKIQRQANKNLTHDKVTHQINEEKMDYSVTYIELKLVIKCVCVYLLL